MKKNSFSISLEHSILGLTDWNCRRNVQVSWASQGTRVCSEHPTQLTIKPHCQPKGTVLWSFPGAMAPCEPKLCPRMHQWAKTSGFWRHPAGESAANFLWTESFGRWSENVGKMCGCCDDPCTPRDLHNTHTFHPTCPNIRPKDPVHRESRHHPSGVSSDT